MITPSEYIQDGKYMGIDTLYGLSTDSKPTSVANGTCFIEIDNFMKKDEDGNYVDFIYLFDANASKWYPEKPASNSRKARKK